MFDIGFSELLLVAIVGLLVLGPERLPVAVRTASVWLGRLRRQFNEIREEVEREIGAEEIRAQLHNENILSDLRESRDALESTARELRQPLLPREPLTTDTVTPADAPPAVVAPAVDGIERT